MNKRLLGVVIAALAFSVSACNSGGGLVTAQGSPKPKPTATANTTATPVATPTPVLTPTPISSASATPSSHPSMTPSPTPTYTQLSATYTLTASGENITFPPDGDATGGSNVPPITTPSVQLDLTESNTQIAGAASNPSTACSEPIYWYATLDLNGTQSQSTTFTSSDIPITFSSPTLVTSGHTYGLCVIALGLVVQDDFNKKIGGAPPVSPSGDTVDLTLVIPSFLGNSFPNNTIASVFFEKK